MRDDQAGLLRALNDTHSAALTRFVLRLTGDRQLTEDVVQETLLRAWRKPAILELDDSSARAWLFTVARNLVIDDRRSARHAREFTTEVLPDPGVPDRTDQILDAWLIEDALAALSPEHRRVVVAAYYGAATVAEIARSEGVPEGTVKSRLHYALRALRLALQERGVTL
ncbi:sigma-70 family RNA polymerase sigma factor [Galbitalea soli]|uniref:RNA polymerase sigma factor n=1 Tax=Galbitalea soli TaxID=1268042 RepID=A0A7C9PLW4_9MICO|nr:sigma-70 family RNA polymerase sigma factor [Galbitalea soli]NEM90331.1 sigma-70 family RNA polymerase sigma factor [Galbitalea soli]NYJ31039.1 RNA polymerase sigma-70 factor (ECF subfamily) [Galbitalea soli]